MEDFRKGLIDGLPIGLGYLSVSFAFGIYATSHGLSVLETLLISMTNLTSAGQLAGVPIIATGGTLLEMALTEFVINLRYALMSITLSQKLAPSVTFIDRFWMAFSNTDEIFAMAVSQKEVRKTYYFGLSVLPFLGWQFGTLMGSIVGDVLPTTVTSALGIAIYGMFVAIVVPVVKKEASTFICVLISMVLSCFCYFCTKIPNGFTIIICAVISSLIMAICCPYKEED